MSIQIFSMRIRNTPGATSTWIPGNYAQFGAFFFVALATLWRRQVLHYAHSNVLEVAQCPFKIWPELLCFIMQAPKATQPAFMM